MNQTPEQLARDKIDSELTRSGWIIQNKNQINLNAGLGIAVREYHRHSSCKFKKTKLPIINKLNKELAA